MLLIFVPIPQFRNFLLLIASNSFAAETSFVVSWTGHYGVALSGCMVGSFKIVVLQASHKDGAGLLVME
jgi:hypothetical protein